jgi:integrase
LNRQRKAKVITGAMLDMAAHQGALSVNPVRGTASIRRPKSERRSLSVDDLATVRTAVRNWMSRDRPGPKGTTDMADIVDLMLATGARIGEVLALSWSDVGLDDEQPTVRLSGTIKTETGKGTYRKPTSGVRTVYLPEFAVDVLRRRRTEARRDSIDAIFPTRNGTWQQVNNVERRWRQIRQDAGLEWVTPDAFRNVTRKVL